MLSRRRASSRLSRAPSLSPFVISASSGDWSICLLEAGSGGEGLRRAAVDAFDRFGKGRHPAALNLGDCCAYACARQAGVPILYHGDDFARTDIETA